MRQWLTERWFLQRLFASGLICGLIMGLAFSGVLNGSHADSTGKLPGQINPIQPSAPIQAPSLPALKKGDPLPENLFVELAKIINPATVNIFTTMNVAPRQY